MLAFLIDQIRLLAAGLTTPFGSSFAGIVPGPSTTKAVAFLFGLCSLHLPSSSESTLRLFPTSVEKKEKCSVPVLLLLLLPVLVVAGVALAGSSDDDYPSIHLMCVPCSSQRRLPECIKR
jgi:hypothetical protein